MEEILEQGRVQVREPVRRNGDLDTLPDARQSCTCKCTAMTAGFVTALWANPMFDTVLAYRGLFIALFPPNHSGGFFSDQ